MARKKANTKPISFAQKLRKLKTAGISHPPMPLNEADELLPLDQRVRKIMGVFQNVNLKSTEMLYFIMYDIEDNKVRTHIAKYLIKKGCTRVQKSIFLGNSDRSVYAEMHQTIKEVQDLYDNDDSVFFVPISTDELRAMKMIGKNVDYELILKQKNTLFF